MDQRIKQRDQITIISDILSIAKEKPIQLTHLWYKANMSTLQFRNHLSWLEKNGFVIIEDRILKITEKGMKMIELLDKQIRV